MAHRTLTDKLQIGKIDFEAYIIKDENNLDAFAVYFQNAEEPLIQFQQTEIDEVEIKINQQLFGTMLQLKSKDRAQRKVHYKRFQEFVLNAEQDAKERVFQDKRLNYITDIQLLKKTEQRYLLD